LTARDEAAPYCAFESCPYLTLPEIAYNNPVYDADGTYIIAIGFRVSAVGFRVLP
jgi:hypothetical protein